MHARRVGVTVLSVWIGLMILVGGGFAFSNAGVRQAVPPLGWKEGDDLPQAAGDGAAFVITETLYHCGGWSGDSAHPLQQVYVSQLQEGEPSDWTSSPHSLPKARLGAAVAVRGEQAYLLGGYDGESLLDRVDRFDGEEWHRERDLPTALNFAASAVKDGRLYVAGGLPGPLADVWSAAIQSGGELGDWRVEAALPRGLMTKLVASGDCLYAIGGKDSAGQQQEEVYRANWGGNGAVTGWAPVASLPRPVALHGAVVRDGTLYVLGGEDDDGALSERVYVATIQPDCSLSSWTSDDLPGQPRCRMAAAVSGRGIYLLGGDTGDSFVQSTWYDLLPAPTPTPAAEMTIRKDATPAKPVRYEDRITYVVSYENSWFQPQTGVVVTDRVPTDTRFIGATPTSTLKSEDILQWSIGELTAGTHETVTFTVVISPPQRTWDLTKTMQVGYDVQGTNFIGTQVTYNITYTLEGDPADGGVLITDTLPSALRPCEITASGEYTYAVRDNKVVWRLDSVSPGTGTLDVTASISRAITATEIITNEVTIYDGYAPLSEIFTGSIASLSTASLVLPSTCLITPSHPSNVPPLYPDVEVRNIAWISSTQLERWQPSNEVIHFWPTSHIYLPLIFRAS